ncbi:MAG: TerB family tellurite resistance protein [Phycisphaeraceae bacterium]
MSITEVELVRAACCIAGLDRDVSDAERPLLKKLANAAGVGKVSLEAMIERARTDQDFYREQFDILKPEPDRAIRSLVQVAMADGEISQSERIILRHFAEQLGVDQEAFERLLSKAEQHLENRPPAAD